MCSSLPTKGLSFSVRSQTGRLRSEQDAVQEALAWEERERQRDKFLFRSKRLARLWPMEGRAITEESMRQLAGEVKERGRARLLAELSNPC